MGNWCGRWINEDRRLYREFFRRPASENGFLVAPSSCDFIGQLQYPCHRGENVALQLGDLEFYDFARCVQCQFHVCHTPSVIISTRFVVCGVCYKHDRVQFLSTLAVPHLLLATVLCINTDVTALLRHAIAKLFISEIRPEKEYFFASEWQYDWYVQNVRNIDGAVVLLAKTEEITTLCDTMGLMVDSVTKTQCRITCSGSDVPCLLRANGKSRIEIHEQGRGGLLQFY
jgi:hypothetical protein